MATKGKGKRYEYYIREVAPNEYEISKFDSMEGGEQPLATYNIEYNLTTKRWKCNCQSAVYRQRQHLEDKHVRMVIAWIAAGKQTTAILE